LLNDRLQEGKQDQAHTSARIYWLAVAAYLLIYLFPVPWSGSDTVFKNAGQHKIVFVDQDWAPSSGLDPVAIVPAKSRPPNAWVGSPRLILKSADLSRRSVHSFDARGPPFAT
jgi:hypothetical protein